MCKFCKLFDYHTNSTCFAVITTNYHRKQWCVLFGKEKGGKCADTYNNLGGKRDVTDQCAIFGALRELFQESKLSFFISNSLVRKGNDYDWSRAIINEKYFEEIFVNKSGKLRTFRQGNTIMMVGKIIGLSISNLNQQITNDNNDQSLGWCYKEMSNVQWFSIPSRNKPTTIVQCITSNKVNGTVLLTYCNDFSYRLSDFAFNTTQNSEFIAHIY